MRDSKQQKDPNSVISPTKPDGTWGYYHDGDQDESATPAGPTDQQRTVTSATLAAAIEMPDDDELGKSDKPTPVRRVRNNSTPPVQTPFNIRVELEKMGCFTPIGSGSMLVALGGVVAMTWLQLNQNEIPNNIPTETPAKMTALS